MPEKPQAEIRMYNGRPTVFINGAPSSLAGFNPCWRRAPFERSIPFFAAHKMGVYIFNAVTQFFWQGDDIADRPNREWCEQPDCMTVDDQVEQALAADPEAYVMVRFTPHPPQSWRALHPQECFLAENGTAIERYPSMASTLAWRMIADVGAAIARYCESRPWAERLIGYTDFTINEGTHGGPSLGWLYDHNPAMVARWRTFLRGRYACVEALREAHRDPTLTFENAPVPRDRLLGTLPQVSALLYWQSSADNQPLRDYLELQRLLWRERFIQMSGALHQAIDRKVILLYDCHKQTMLGWNLDAFFGPNVSWRTAYPEVMAASGHQQIAALLDVPGCNGLMTPLDYQARGIGGVCESEGISDSVVLREQYYYGEMDQRSSPVGDHEFGTPRTDRELASLTWRNLATAWTRGWNAYWFDIGGDYYSTAARHETIARQVQVIKRSQDWQHETVPGIAMLLDDTAVLETNGAGNYLNEAVMWEQKLGLPWCGVPHRTYLLEDLALPDFPAHCVFYFPNLFRVDDARLAQLREKVFCNGHVVVWGPGSGISDGRAISAESAARLTGFAFRLLPANVQRRVRISNYDHPITRDLPANLLYGGALPYGPVLYPKDGDELGLAWTKWEANELGLAVKTFGKGALGGGASGPFGPGDYAAVFTVAVPLPASLWRGIARYAGAHVYCDDNELVLADGSVVAMHSIKSGRKRLALPGKRTVYDLVNDVEFARDTDVIEFELHAPETRVFRLA